MKCEVVNLRSWRHHDEWRKGRRRRTLSPRRCSNSTIWGPWRLREELLNGNAPQSKQPKCGQSSHRTLSGDPRMFYTVLRKKALIPVLNAVLVLPTCGCAENTKEKQLSFKALLSPSFLVPSPFLNRIPVCFHVLQTHECTRTHTCTHGHAHTRTCTHTRTLMHTIHICTLTLKSFPTLNPPITFNSWWVPTM